MHMKSFTAPTMTEAMEIVRFEMGAESIIIATHDEKDGAVITAAMEDTAPNGLKISETGVLEETPVYDRDDTAEVIRQSLAFHGVPVSLSNRLTDLATSISADSPTLALAAAMDEVFTFDPISTFLSQPNEDIAAPRILLMGAPGVGKTVTTAKLASLVAMDKNRPRVITTDTQRAGGIEQLAAFTRILGIELETTNDAKGLLNLMQDSNTDVPIFVDTSSTNPFDTTEMEHLEALANVSRFEKIVVIAAGGDAMETCDIAAEFSSIGAKRMVITRLDMTRRLGSILTAAHAGRLSLSDISITPGVANGINPINPVSLARLIMPYTDTDTNGSIDRTAQNTNIIEAMI
jgi:flagellar biosynthesis protein FlhF